MTYETFYLLMVCLVLIAVAGTLAIWFFLDATKPTTVVYHLTDFIAGGN